MTNHKYWDSPGRGAYIATNVYQNGLTLFKMDKYNVSKYSGAH